MASNERPHSGVTTPASRRSFRVQSIPSNWTDSTLAENLKTAFPNAGFVVRSLCPQYPPSSRSSQTAIITGEYSQNLPSQCSDLLSNKARYSSICLDSHELYIDTCLDMTILLTPPEPDADIIFVHGLGGHAIGSWTATNGKCWPIDFLPGDFPSWRVISFGYDANLEKDSSTARLADYGEKLRNGIRNIRNNGKDQTRALILVGHSAGGAVILRALHQLKDTDQPKDQAVWNAIRALVFFGVPLEGTSLDSLRRLTERRSEPSKQYVLDDLRPNSEFLGFLRSTSRKLRIRDDPKVAFITFVEDAKEPGQVFVEKSQARVNADNEEVISIYSSHRDMAKFPSDSFGPYITLVRNFQDKLDITSSKSKAHGRIVDLSSTRTLLDEEFVGRKSELNRLRDRLVGQRKPGQLSIVGIVGLPGVGKTQLALQYLERFHQEYDVSFSTSVSNAVTYGDTIASLVRELVGKSERSLKANYARLRLWLRENPETRTLLIFDDIDDMYYKDYLEEMPRRGTGDIIVTTRGRAAAEHCTRDIAKVFKLDEWDDTEALEYLHQRIPEHSRIDDHDAMKIVEAVNGLPLALEQVVQHTLLIEQSLSDTVVDISKNKLRVLRHGTIRRGVAECFETTFVGLKHHFPEALKLFSALAFLDSQSLYSNILDYQNITDILSLQDLDSVQVKIAMSNLKAFQLLKTNPVTKVSSIHGLAQELFRYWLPQEECENLLLETIEFMWSKFPYAKGVHEESMWEQASIYLSHTLKVIEHCEKFGVRNHKVFDLWIRAGQTMAEKGFGEQAEVLTWRACSTVSSLQVSVKEKIEALVAHGYVINYSGNFEAAAPFYEDALKIAKNKLDKADERTLTCLHNFAGIYNKRGDTERAMQIWKEVIDIGRNTFQNLKEGVHPYGSMISLAVAYRVKNNTGSLSKSESLLREAATGLGDRQGSKSSWTLYAVAELGTTLLCQTRLGTRQATQEAECLLEQAYKGLSEVLGPEDQYTQDARDTLFELRELLRSSVITRGDADVD